MTQPAPAPTNAQQVLLSEVVEALEPVVLAAANPVRRQALLDALGWDPGALIDLPPGEFTTWLGNVAEAIETIQGLVEHPPQTLPDLITALAAVQTVVGTARTLPPKITNLSTAVIPAGLLAEDLITTVVVTWLQRRHQRLLDLLVLLGVVVLDDARPPDPPTLVPAPPGSADLPRALRLGGSRPQLRLARLVALVRDPVGTLRADYFPNGLASDLDAEDSARLLFGRLAALLSGWGVEVMVGLPAAEGSGLDDVTAALGRTMLTLSVPLVVGEVRSKFGISLALSSAESGGLGLVVVPSGEAKLSHPVGAWQLTGDLAAAGSGFAIGPQGVTPPAGPPGEVAARIELSKERKQDEPAIRLGSTTGTRLEIGSLRAWVAGRFGGARDDVEIGAEASDAALVIAPGDGDGFLRAVLPAGGLRTEFDLGLAWSQRQGLHVHGTAGLDATFPLHLALGPLEIISAHVALGATDTGLTLAVSGSAKLALGPVTASVEKIGVEAALTFPEKSTGNLGPANLDVRFKPPSGIALAVDAGPVTGGGYLFFDPDHGQYAGALALEMEGIALKAVGLLTTRMPDGSDGFSLLVVISAEFTPIQLGFGFTLNGVGGLIGINRTMAIDALRAGVRTRALEGVLFPKDPVGHATELVASLGALFPPAPGRHVVGPMAKLGWGTPTLLTVDIGLLLELPTPVRLALLGRLHLALPREDAALVVMNMDVLGVLDLDRGEVSIDATLYDSRIAGFALSGDMALRARWKGTPVFALSAGGFHPRFQPPPGFPTLQRMALSLVSGDNPRVRLESYLALTSNTVQFGARLELYAKAGDFSVTGMLGFDALFAFDPFAFVVDIAGMLALKYKTTSLAAVSIQMSLSGPTPWRVQGTAHFELLCFSGEIRFDTTFGSAIAPPPPRPVPVAGRVVDALKQAGSWSARLPAPGESVVTLRSIPTKTGELLVHPLGGLSVTQRVAPLKVRIDHMGTAPVEGGPTTLDITAIAVNGAALPAAAVTATREYFAAAQFVDMTDDEKLSRPSFELMEAGRAVAAVDFGRQPDEDLVESPLNYEEWIVDEPDTGAPPRPVDVPSPMTPEQFRARIRVSPAALAPTRRGPAGRFGGPGLRLALEDPDGSLAAAGRR